MRLRSLLLASLIAAYGSTGAIASPKIGDAAPAIKAAKWHNDKPAALPTEPTAKGKVFLVEFWATWCAPCRRSIPHLAELHKKHASQGLIVIGVSNEEAAVVEGFVKKMNGGGKNGMPYHIAVDDDNATAGKWTDDIDGIPHAFIVDKTGKVVWTGNPLAEASDMDDAIRQLLADKFNIEEARKSAAATKQYQAKFDELRGALGSEDVDKAMKVLDEMHVLKPRELQSYFIRRQLLTEMGKLDQIPDCDARMEAAVKDVPSALVMIVDFQMSLELDKRDAGVLVRSAMRANELTRGEDMDALAALARVQCEMGLLEAAIASQEKAVKAAGDTAEEAQKVLAYYKALKSLADRHRGDLSAAR